MLFYPQLEVNEATRDFQEEFGGYNHNPRILENQFYNMKNMSGDYYPVLSPRKKRGYIKQLTDCTAVICKDSLCYIDCDTQGVGHLYVNESEIEAFSSTQTALIETVGVHYAHIMIAMGAYLIIFHKHPNNGIMSGWYYNTANSSDYGYINNNWNSNYRQITLSTCGYDGKDYNFTASDTEPSEKENGTKWLDTSGDVHYLKEWSAAQSMWVTLSTTYVKISSPGIANGFKQGDGVKISDLYKGGVSDAVAEQIKVLNNTTIIQSIDEDNHDWIVVIGILDNLIQTAETNVNISRTLPYMDYICEHNNRLWGCRYGLNRESETVNEIYASKQGDFKNWFCYAGISTDSYAVSVGSEDRWTGCTPFGNSVLFFKENVIHKIYGTIPANFQTSEQRVRGIQRGSEKSLCFVNEVLFYKSATDVCYYDGSTPRSISSALGDEKYKNAVFGSVNNKLYCNMQDESNMWQLFVYDTVSQTWHCEDNLHCKDICRVDTDLYFISKENVLGTFTGAGTLEKEVEWFAETGNIGYSYSDNKYLGKIAVRFKKPITSELRILIQYDDGDVWSPISSICGHGVSSISIPIIPRRCDHFRIRFEGKGECKIISLTKTIELGSDV